MFRKRPDRIRGIAGSLEGQTVLVVGATAAAGPGIVRVLAEAGASVFAAAPDAPTLDVQLSRLGSTPTPVVGITADPTTATGRSQLLSALPTQVDALVVNPDLDAGAAASAAAFELVTTVVTEMQDRGHAGSIVIVSSISRLGPAGSAAAYLQSETEQLAARLAPNAIRVNAVATGPVGANRRGNPLSNRATPLGHVSLHPVEIGKAVWFLLNENLSAGITGSSLKIDRGASLLHPEW